ncbi:MAG: extracellular solute-binding protein, partial [Microvirga sp.]
MTTTRTGISRRALLLGTAAFGGAAALGTSTSWSKSAPVRFGIYGNAQKLEVRGRSIARFNELHPDAPVTFEGIPSASWPDKIAAMVAGGNAPDVITLGGEDLPQYASRGALTPVDGFIPAQFRASLFDKTVLDLGRIDGKLYGIPIAVSIQGSAYNQSALERLGMSE